MDGVCENRRPVRIRDTRHLPVIPVVAERRTGISELGALLRLGGCLRLEIPGQARDDAERHMRIPVRIRDTRHLPVIPVVAERRTGISELGALLRLGGC